MKKTEKSEVLRQRLSCGHWIAGVVPVLKRCQIFLFGVAALFPVSCSTNYNLGSTENVTGATGLSVDGGIPLGSFMSFEKRDFGSFTAQIRSVLVLRQDGLGHYAITHALQWKPPATCPRTPFVGQNVVLWTIQQPLQRIVREGNKLFVYVDPTALGTLTTSTPQGYGLRDFEGLGDGILGGFRSPLRQVGVSVFQMSGENLTLTSAHDGINKNFKRQKFSR